MDNITDWMHRNSRFLFSLIPAIVMLIGTIAVVSFINNSLKGGIGLVIGLIAGACLALGIVLLYWNTTDWLNLRVIRNQLGKGHTVLRDGAVVAFNGIVRSDSKPMISPFTGIACAAYTYKITRSSPSRTHRTSRLISLGYHMNITRIDGNTLSLRLCSLPSFEDGMRENMNGPKYADKAKALIAKISVNSKIASEREQNAGLLEARHSETREIHQDFSRTYDVEQGIGLTIDEEVLPIDQEVCAVGTYDKRLRGLTAKNPRLGPNLIVYKGSAEEVILRVGSEIAGFTKMAIILIAIGIVPLSFAFLPTAWTSSLPVIGELIVR